MVHAAFKSTNCILPASGYYELQAAGGEKQPYFIGAANGAVLWIAGRWDQWHIRKQQGDFELQVGRDGRQRRHAWHS